MPMLNTNRCIEFLFCQATDGCIFIIPVTISNSNFNNKDLMCIPKSDVPSNKQTNTLHYNPTTRTITIPMLEKYLRILFPLETRNPIQSGRRFSEDVNQRPRFFTA